MKVYIFYVTFFVAIIFTSCNNVSKEYYENGMLKKEYTKSNGVLHGVYKEYYRNGNIKLKHNYDLGVLKDSSLYFLKDVNKIDFIRFWSDSVGIKQIEYYPNGNLEKYGYVNDKFFKIGKWNFYNENGHLDVIRQYKIIDGNHHLNQEWKLNVKGDTLYTGSKYFDIQVMDDTISKGEQFLAAAFLRAQLYKDKPSEILVCLPNGEKDNFNKDFSNIREIKLDTFYNLHHDVKNQKNFEGFHKSYSVAFGKRFSEITGKRDIRGFIQEYYKEGDSIFSTKMYFDIPIYIKDTILPEPETKKIAINY